MLYGSLEQRGLISGFEGMQSTTIKLGADGKGFFIGQDLVLALEGKPDTMIRQAAMFLTEIGKELLPLLPKPDEAPLMKEMAAELSKNKDVTKITVGRKISFDKMTLDEVLYERPL